MTTSLRQVYLPLQFNQILEIVKQLGADERRRLLLFLLGQLPDKNDLTLTHLASEEVLAKDWLTETEDEAWQHL
ncbi:MAG: hypothetical protein JNJ90_12050 [Saprospiraceae bacterium]|jgi:hypothetical protein|nr:hypothetical protein [Saprospiraceae bacterium]